MTTEWFVKDYRNFPIGRYYDTGDSLIGINFKKGYVGRYAKNIDITFDKTSKVFCYGNGIESLIRKAEDEK